MSNNNTHFRHDRITQLNHELNNAVSELNVYKNFHNFTVVSTAVVYTIVGIVVGWIIFVGFGVWN